MGVSAIVFGSILCWLIRLAALGPNIEERLKKINEHRAAWYLGRKGVHLLPKIFQSNLRSRDWANLNGKVFKAANTRTASGFCLWLANRY